MALDSAWTIWAHLPHEQDWSMASYTPIMRVTTACELWGLIQLLPQALMTDMMLFLMKDDTKPIWEDPVNSQGGYFSYKVMNKNVGEAWKSLMLRVGGGTLSDDAEFNATVTGVSPTGRPSTKARPGVSDVTRIVAVRRTAAARSR